MAPTWAGPGLLALDMTPTYAVPGLLQQMLGVDLK